MPRQPSRLSEGGNQLRMVSRYHHGRPATTNDQIQRFQPIVIVNDQRNVYENVDATYHVIRRFVLAT